MHSQAARYYFLHDHLAVEAHKILRGHVNSANRELGLNHTNKPLAVFQWGDENGMIAGGYGIVYPGWLFLDLLWVESSYRKQGIGSALLKQIEDEAIRLGAHSAYLWTHEFEAPDFYRKYDYREFVQLNEFLPGHQLIGMQKKFIA